MSNTNSEFEQPYKPSGILFRKKPLNNKAFASFSNAFNCSKIPNKFKGEKMIVNALCDKSFPEHSKIEKARLKALSTGSDEAIKDYFTRFRRATMKRNSTTPGVVYNSNGDPIIKTGGSKKRKSTKRHTKKKSAKKWN